MPDTGVARRRRVCPVRTTIRTHRLAGGFDLGIPQRQTGGGMPDPATFQVNLNIDCVRNRNGFVL